MMMRNAIAMMATESVRPVEHISVRLVSACAAHDLANYLQIISSAVRIIERSLSCEARAALDAVFRGAQTSLEHAHQLSRQVASQPIAAANGGLRVSIAQRITALQPVILLALRTGIEVEYHIADAPDVFCDGEQLDNVIMNLIINSVRAMSNGGRLLIGVRTEITGSDDLPAAVLRVGDTGCGIAADMVATAFKPGVTTKSDKQGSGLGLAMVEAFARSAGGDAAIESEVGIGTVVTIRLPGALKPAKRSS